METNKHEKPVSAPDILKDVRPPTPEELREQLRAGHVRPWMPLPPAPTAAEMADARRRHEATLRALAEAEDELDDVPAFDVVQAIAEGRR